MGVGAQPTVAVYKLLSLVRTSHAHYRYTVLYMILCMAAVVNRGCLYSNSGVQTIAHACTNNAEQFKGEYLRTYLHLPAKNVLVHYQPYCYMSSVTLSLT